MPRPASARLIVASSEHDPDMLYATRFFCPDPFLFLQDASGRRTIVLSDLEVDRGRKEAKVDEIVSLSEELKQLKLANNTPFPHFCAAFLKARRIRSAEVPGSFPFGLAHLLTEAGIRLRPVSGLFWAEREHKTETELRRMGEALRVTEAGMARGMEVLRATDFEDKGRTPGLRWSGRPLTSEILRAEIDSAILRAGGTPANTIVAGGEQACDPHERGHGPLRAHSLIILDIFPRHATHGYYGDMTRTVVRGRASDAQRHLWLTVQAGQEKALKAMKPGADGHAIHESVKTFFKESGYPTEQVNGRWRGFFHGTGHGLGLEIHETPRFSMTKFQPGQVITVEPGLYWPRLGGVRLEDVAAITATGVRKLSRFVQELEL